MSSDKERKGTPRADQDALQDHQTQPIAAMELETLAEPGPEADAEDTETIVALAPQEREPSARLAPSSSLLPMLLERIEPSLGRGERLRLDASHWKLSLGRAEESDIRLYTASASREHAVIAGNEAGEWVLTLAAGRSVLIDGEITTEPVVLEVGMNIILGHDHLRCVTEGLAPREMTAQTAADGFEDRGNQNFWVLRRLAGRPGAGWWTMGVLAAIGVGLIVFALLSR